MRDTLFRLLAGVLAVVIIATTGVVLFTDARLVGSWIDALWMGGVSLLLLSAFTGMAIAGPKRAHQILTKGMKLLGMVGDEPVPEKIDPRAELDRHRAKEGRSMGPDEENLEENLDSADENRGTA